MNVQEYLCNNKRCCCSQCPMDYLHKSMELSSHASMNARSGCVLIPPCRAACRNYPSTHRRRTWRMVIGGEVQARTRRLVVTGEARHAGTGGRRPVQPKPARAQRAAGGWRVTRTPPPSGLPLPPRRHPHPSIHPSVSAVFNCPPSTYVGWYGATRQTRCQAEHSDNPRSISMFVWVY